MSNITISPDLLPNSLRLSPHLSAHKYFFVCTLTVAAWDSLVLSPRSWKLLKSEGWPVLKAMFFFLRILMPVEFVIVGTCQPSYLVVNQLTSIICTGVAFFDSGWSRSVSSPSPGYNAPLISPSPSGLSKIFPLRADMHGNPLGCVFEYVVSTPIPTVPEVNIDFSQWFIPSESMASMTKIAQCSLA